VTTTAQGSLARFNALLDAGRLREMLEEVPGTPDDPRLALLAADARRQLMDFEGAESLLLHALAGLSGRPEYPSALTGLARVYMDRGEYARARPLLDKALEVHRNPAQPDPEGHVDTLLALAALLGTLGRRAEEAAALAEARALAGSGGRVQAELLLHEGLALNAGHVEAADRLRRAIAQMEGDGRGAGSVASQARLALGRALLALERPAEAGPLLRRADEGYQAIWGEAHPRRAATLGGLALHHLASGQPHEAEALARRAAGLIPPSEKSLEAAASQESLADLLSLLGKFEEAAEAAHRALPLVERFFGPGHGRTVHLRGKLATLDEMAGCPREAAERLREVLEAAGPDAAEEAAELCQHLARLREGEGLVTEAAELRARAADLTKSLPTDPFRDVPALADVAERALRSGRLGEAREACGRLPPLLAPLPAHHSLRLEALRGDALLARRGGDVSSAAGRVRSFLAAIEESDVPWRPAKLRGAADLLALLGANDEAERAYEKALALLQKDPESPERGLALRGLARLCMARGNLPGASIRFREALESRKNAVGEEHPEFAEALDDLAGFAQVANDPLGAEAMYQQAHAVRAKALGPLHVDTLASLLGLASALGNRGETARAAGLLEGPLAKAPREHPSLPALGHLLGLIRADEGRHAEAITLLSEAAAAREKVSGPDGEQLLPVLRDLMRVHAARGDVLKARELINRLIGQIGPPPLDGPLERPMALLELASTHRQLADLKATDSISREALRLAEKALPRGDVGLTGYLVEVGRSCLARGRRWEAGRHLRRAYALAVKAHGKDGPLAANLTRELASLEAASGRPERAVALGVEACDRLAAAVGEDHPDYANARLELAGHLLAVGNHSGAVKELTRRLEIIRRTLGSSHPRVAEAMHHLSSILQAGGDQAAALRQAEAALEIARRAERPADSQLAGLLHTVALLRSSAGQRAEARKLLSEALRLDDEAGITCSMAHLDSLRELAFLEAADGKRDVAREGITRLLVAQKRLAPACAYLPAGPQRDFLLASPWMLTESYLCLTNDCPKHHAEALDQVIRWEAVHHLDLGVGNREELLRRHPDLASRLGRMIDLGMQVAQCLSNGPGLEGMAAHAELLATWEAEREELEAELAPRVPQVARLRKWRNTGLEEVRAALPSGAVLVVPTHYTHIDFGAVCDGNLMENKPKTTVFVLQPNQPVERIEMAGLSSQRRLERLLSSGRQVILTGGGRIPGARPIDTARELVSPLLALKPRGWWARLRAWLGW
jgi:tetratricopeptide (TPR) repeat protein